MHKPPMSAPSTLSSPPTITTTSTDRPNTPMLDEMPPIEPTMIPEMAASMAEATQDSENTRGTLMPTEYAAAWSLAVARSATPPRQKRNTSSTAAMNSTAITAPQNTLGARKASPTMMGCVGMKSGRRRWSALQIISTRPTSTEARPTVTMNTEMGGSPSSGRIMVRSITAPRRPVPSTAAGIAIHSGSAIIEEKVKNR